MGAALKPAAGMMALAFCAVLAGCSALGLGPRSEGQLVASHDLVATRDAFVPKRFLSKVGEGAEDVVFSAQVNALNSPRSGQPVTWEWKGTTGRVTPGPVYMVNAKTCRDVVHVAERDAERLLGRATACRTADGRWERLI